MEYEIKVIVPNAEAQMAFCTKELNLLCQKRSLIGVPQIKKA